MSATERLSESGKASRFSCFSRDGSGQRSAAYTFTMRQTDYALDTAAARIVSPRTRELFTEPLECYLNGAYRLAVVGLWTVVVFDLLEKVGEMADLYKDPVAQTLLSDVEKERKNCEVQKSPRWESWLLDQVSARTQLLELADKLHLTHLYDLRNLCAHPLLQQHTPELQQVRQETAKACFVHALEGLLTKPALLTGQITERLLQDLGARNWNAVRPEEFDRYFSARYVDRLSEAALSQLFRTLWKLTFKDDSSEARRAREELGQMLAVVYTKSTIVFGNAIESDGAFFGNIVVDGGRGEALHAFLRRHQGIYDRLPDPTKADLEEYLRDAPSAIRKSGFYRYPNLSSYVRSIEPDIKAGKLTVDALESMPDLSADSNAFEILASLVTAAWRESPGYTTSGRLSVAVEYVLPRVSHGQLEALMSAANENQQVYGCALAAESCTALLREVRKRGNDLADIARFPNLSHEINATAPATK